MKTERERKLEAALQKIVDATPANKPSEWHHHHWYLVTSREALADEGSGDGEAKSFVVDAVAYGTGFSKGGQRIDPLEFYKDPPQDEALEALDVLFSAAIDDQGWLWSKAAQREYEKVRRALAQSGESD